MDEIPHEDRQHSRARDTGENGEERSFLPTPANTIASNPQRLRFRSRSLEDILLDRTKRLAERLPPLNHFIQRTAELDEALHIEALQRAKLDFARQKWQQHSRTYRTTRSSYESAVDPFRTRSTPRQADEQISDLRAVLIKHRSNFEISAADVRTARQQMQAAQRSREKCELKLTQFPRQSADYFKIPLVTSGDLTFLPAEGDFETLLERFKQKVTEAKALREQLADHDSEYWDQVAGRELSRDQDETVSVTDSEFEVAMKRKKEAIEQELSKAYDEVKRLKEECMAAQKNGIDLEEDDIFDTQSMEFLDIASGSRARHEQGLQNALSRVPPAAFENAEVIRGGSSSSEDSHVVVDARASRFVQDWIADVPADAGQPGDEDP